MFQVVMTGSLGRYFLTENLSWSAFEDMAATFTGRDAQKAIGGMKRAHRDAAVMVEAN